MASSTLRFLLIMRLAIAWPMALAAADPALASGREQKPAPRPSESPADEIIEIDGGKNPELIPQWAAWEFAFRVINGGSKELPSNVHFVVSREEAALISAEAVANEKRDKECQNRILDLMTLIGKERTSVVNTKQAEIQLDCRWQTLRARDRLLERLRPEVQTELIRFVEDMKGGTKVEISKRELAHYLQPQ